MYVSDKRLYRTLDDRVVSEGDPDAAFLLVGEGGMLSDEDARKYGLSADQPEMPSPLEQARDRLAAAEERGAYAEAEGHRVAVTNLELEEARMAESKPARGTRRASAPAADEKAVSGPPENKASATATRKADEDK